MQRSKPLFKTVWLDMSHWINKHLDDAPKSLRIQYIFDSTVRTRICSATPYYDLAPVELELEWEDEGEVTDEQWEEREEWEVSMWEGLENDYFYCSTVNQNNPEPVDQLNEDEDELEEYLDLEKENQYEALMNIVRWWRG